MDLAEAGKLAGFVVDTNGAAQEWVELHVSNVLGLDGQGYQMPETAPVKTGAGGRFTIEGLPEGYVTLMCRKPGFQQKTSVQEIYEVPDKRFAAGMRKEIRIEMVGTGTISGTVVDPNGRPYTGQASAQLEAVEGAGSWGGGTQVKDGKFEFKNVPPGKYRISTNPRMHFDKDAADVRTIEVTVGKTTTVELTRRGPDAGRLRRTTTRAAKSD